MNKNKKRLLLPEKALVLPTNGAQNLDKVFLGTPTRTGYVSAGTAQAAMVQATRSRIVLFRASTHTNLELNYNMLLCDALNLRDHDGVTWFAMLHDDIQPEPFWIDTLIDEANKHGADAMSAHVPLKDPRQVSSTAMADPHEEWFPYTRLTLKQIHHPDFPETIDTKSAISALENLPADMLVDCPPDSELLINTGCMVMRLDRPWINRIHFHKKDTIVYENGGWCAMTWTEDWQLAQDLHDVGAKVMATRKVKLTHFDGKRFFPCEPDANGQNRDESTIQVRAIRHGSKPVQDEVVVT